MSVNSGVDLEHQKLFQSLLEKFSHVRPEAREVFANLCYRKIIELETGMDERVLEDAKKMREALQTLFEKDKSEDKKRILIKTNRTLTHYSKKFLRPQQHNGDGESAVTEADAQSLQDVSMPEEEEESQME